MQRTRSASGGEKSGLAPAPNRAGLPDTLKAGVEALSGLAMDDVRVHRNSAEPAKLGALAFTQGSDIHVGPGQERHLAHEAWHVVQQKEGRVAATMQLAGTRINDDGALETEADLMGAAAIQIGETAKAAGLHTSVPGASPKPRAPQLAGRRAPAPSPGGASAVRIPVIQRAVHSRWRPADRLDAQEAVVQAVSYRRTGGGEEEVVNVETADDRVTLSGHVRVEDELVPVTGSVPLRADEVTQNQVVAHGDAATRIPAMRVRNITASPTRMRLGNLLTLYHALAAQERGIAYVVARDIVGTAESFYTGLGFDWFLDPGPRPQLQAQRHEIQERMQAIVEAEAQRGRPLPRDFDGRTPMEIAGGDLIAMDETIGRAGMFVRTDTLIQASRAALEGFWEAA